VPVSGTLYIILFETTDNYYREHAIKETAQQIEWLAEDSFLLSLY